MSDSLIPPQPIYGDGDGDSGAEIYESDGESGSSGFEEYNDDAEGTSSSGSSFEELGDEDFPRYFSERDGRLYHSSPSAPYPLPVDTPEQERFTVSHNALKSLMRNLNYIGPVPAVLSVLPNQERKALDICCGNGKWVVEMAEAFPDVHFTGLDIVPIATRYPPPNARFILGDANHTLEWQNSTYDLVHARDTSMAIINYNHLVEEIARVLKPGGLFLSVEWDRTPAFHRDFPFDPEQHAPAAVQLHQIIDQALFDGHGIHSRALQCADTLAASPRFTNFTPQEIHVPIGGWEQDPVLHRTGLALKVAQRRFARACKHLLLDHTTLTPDEIDVVVQDYVTELRTTSRNGMMAKVHVAYATKI